ncbi:glycosyltransferase family 2 protein [Anseongella ginsenosidimutans]|nr:glycosyltransferase [Anseongella ginsenosidimutans]
MVPCTIRHIQLEKNDEDFSQLLHQSYYCLFWWQQIPLGHLFLAPGKYADAADLRKAVLKAVSPAIDFYAAGNGHTARSAAHAGNYREPFLGGDHPGFAAVLEKVFDEAPRPPDGGKSLNISVIICTRNRAGQLRRCLDLLLSQRWRPAEIIVVDNAPEDRSTEQLAARYPAVRYHPEPRPGLDIARNTGARLARQPLVAYVDDDVLVHPEWTYRVWEVFQDPDIAAMTGLVIASALDTESQLIFEKFWSFNRGYRDKLFDTFFIQQNLRGGPPVWEIGAGANMAFRKMVLEKVGYFDERLDVGAAGCSGDSEIWFRILSAGMRILYTPRAVVYHEHRGELRALRKQLFYYMRGFTAAALIQHKQNPQAGYRRHFYRVLAPYYWRLLKEGLPHYRGRHRTIVNELSGILSGVLFFRKNRHKPSQTLFSQP